MTAPSDDEGARVAALMHAWLAVTTVRKSSKSRSPESRTRKRSVFSGTRLLFATQYHSLNKTTDETAM
jgi:hypothetical protein